MEDPQDQIDQDEISYEGSSTKSRGRKRIPERWMGVINIDKDDLSNLKLRDLATELLMAPYLPIQSTARKGRSWELLFYPKDFIKEHKSIELNDFLLPDQKLKTLGIEVSKARERFKQAAEYTKADEHKKP